MGNPYRKKKKKRSKAVTVLLICIIVVCLAIAGIAAYICIDKILSDQKSIRQFDEIRDNVVTEVDNEGEEREKAPIEVDFDELWKINKDVIAWLYVPCLDISYPVLKSDDNQDYLHTDIYGNYLYAGCLFTDRANSPDFSDPHTFIYGHNMMNGTMFGYLWHIVYQDAAKDDPYFWVITPEGDFKYQMFSAFETSTDSKVYTLFLKENMENFQEDLEEWLDWCDEMKEASQAEFQDYQFSIDDQIVTLSTCQGTGTDGGRTLVMGVCINGPVGNVYAEQQGIIGMTGDFE